MKGCSLRLSVEAMHPEGPEDMRLSILVYDRKAVLREEAGVHFHEDMEFYAYSHRRHVAKDGQERRIFGLEQTGLVVESAHECVHLSSGCLQLLAKFLGEVIPPAPERPIVAVHLDEIEQAADCRQLEALTRAW